MKFKTQIAAIAYHLLIGKKITIMNAFNYFGCTNAPREISRSIEDKFGVEVKKTQEKFVSRYGRVGVYYEYELERKKENKEGIKAMTKYVMDNTILNVKNSKHEKR